jgi:thiamine-monophosphate kinase
MDEFELIARLTKSLPTDASVLAGAGDDCAVLELGVPAHLVLFKTDAVVEGVHFTAETPPEKVGHKALGRCLSDIAAMAGTPHSALVTLALPREFDVAWVDGLYAGMTTLATRFGVSIVGGETTMNPERRLISIALLGTVERGKQVLRSGARPGDVIFVSGELGGSLAGRHLDFEPRVREAQWLARQFDLHAMLDISDGLAGDLRHLLRASGVGAELRAAAIPVSRAAKLRAAQGGKPRLLAALSDGEDFELLFALGSKDAVALLDSWKGEFPALKLSCIGRIIEGHELVIRDKDGVRPLTAHGYVHFE